MERTKGVDIKEDTRPRWKKTGGGSLRLRGRIIKPGQVFRAYSHEIPDSFKDVVIAIDGQESVTEDKKVEAVALEYKLQPREGGGGWFDVVDTNGKRINEKACKRQAALDLIATLQE